MLNEESSPEKRLTYEEIAEQLTTGEKIPIAYFPDMKGRIAYTKEELNEYLDIADRVRHAKEVIQKDGIYALWMEGEILLYIDEAENLSQRILKTHQVLPKDTILTNIPRYLEDFAKQLRTDLKIDISLDTRESKKDFLTKYCFWRICPLNEIPPLIIWDGDNIDTIRAERKKTNTRRKRIEKRLIDNLRPVFRHGTVWLNKPLVRRKIKQIFSHLILND